jgi:hypothetical protein
MVVRCRVQGPVLLPLGLTQTSPLPEALNISRPSGSRMTTGLPPVVSVEEPEVTGSALMLVHAAPPTEKKFSGFDEIL